jgi:hypothetical protein
MSVAPDQPAATASITVEYASGSVDYLVQTFHVSTAEAVRRQELQRTAAGLQEELAAGFPDVYAGAWIDQEHGGILNIGATDPAGLSGLKFRVNTSPKPSALADAGDQANASGRKPLRRRSTEAEPVEHELELATRVLGPCQTSR